MAWVIFVVRCRSRPRPSTMSMNAGISRLEPGGNLGKRYAALDRDMHSKPPNVVTRWGTNPNVGNLEWGSESEFLTELLR